MKSKRHHPPGRQVKILAAVRISKASGRDMLSGMFRFIEQNPSWQLHLVQYDSDFTADAVRRAPDEGFDGIVVTSPGAKGYIDALAETPLPVVLVSVHASKVESRRRQMEGVSLRRAIEGHRLEEAKRLLSRTGLSVTAIAERVGFSGQNRLSHVFKARFGVAPELWRTSRRNVHKQHSPSRS